MSELSEDVRTKKNITQIAIPGSHDCGTYALNKKLPVGPDEADILQSLGKISFKYWLSKIFGKKYRYNLSNIRHLFKIQLKDYG